VEQCVIQNRSEDHHGVAFHQVTELFLEQHDILRHLRMHQSKNLITIPIDTIYLKVIVPRCVHYPL